MKNNRMEELQQDLELLNLQNIADDMKTNTEIDTETDDPEELRKIIKLLRTNIIKYEKKQKSMVKYFEHEKESLKTKVTRELLDKLCQTHNEIFKSQENMYEEIINNNLENHESKLKALCCYYDTIIEGLKKKNELYESTNKNLVKEIEILQTEMLSNNKKLDNIKNLILDKSIKNEIELEAPMEACNNVLEVQKEKCVKPKIPSETEKIQSLTKDIDKLNELITNKDMMIQTIIVQLKSSKELNSQYDRDKTQLLADSLELTKSVENMQIRHGEQFKDYEKLLKKSKQEIQIHKREIMRLREHISSPHFQGSPIIPKQRQFLQTYHSNSSPNLSSIHKKPNEEIYMDNWSDSQSSSEISTFKEKQDDPDSVIKTCDKKTRGRPRKLCTPNK